MLNRFPFPLLLTLIVSTLIVYNKKHQLFTYLFSRMLMAFSLDILDDVIPVHDPDTITIHGKQEYFGFFPAIIVKLFFPNQKYYRPHRGMGASMYQKILS
jgi:hypothetical protein